MAYNNATESYDEYPNSQFPGKIMDLPNMVDVSAALRPIVDQYNTAWINNDTAAINLLISNNPDLLKALFNASKFNTLSDNVKSLQAWNKQKLIEATANAVGIKDDATGDEQLINAYSVKKMNSIIENHTGIELATNITIPISSWVSNTSVSGFNYSYTYNNSAILATDEVYVEFNDESVMNASKISVHVKSDGGAGSFILLARKIPKTELIIKRIEVIRRG